jgi:hypothetical protein
MKTYLRKLSMKSSFEKIVNVKFFEKVFDPMILKRIVSCSPSLPTINMVCCTAGALFALPSSQASDHG